MIYMIHKLTFAILSMYCGCLSTQGMTTGLQYTKRCFLFIIKMFVHVCKLFSSLDVIKYVLQWEKFVYLNCNVMARLVWVIDFYLIYS
jgi:hypothetical protein